MDCWGLEMPLPDANKKSPRVYTNLQNTDLDNVTFANVQATGNTIAIEELNEDEMRRLVLVNLARLVCAGEWNGLLSAGGGGGDLSYNVPSVVCGATGNFKYWNIGTLWGGTVGSNVVATNLSSENQYWYPFLAPQDGAPAGVSVYVNSATTSQNVYVSFYESTNGYPSTMMGYATISTDSTGAIRVTSFTEASSGSLTFEQGTQYFCGFNKSGDETAQFMSVEGDQCASIVPDNVVSSSGDRELAVESVATTTSAPVDVADTTEIQGSGAGGNFRFEVWIDF